MIPLRTHIILPLFFAILLPFQAFAQQGLMTHGPVFRMTQKDFHERIVYAGSQYFFLLHARYNALGERTTYLERYRSESMEHAGTSMLVWRNAHQNTSSRFKLYFENVLSLGDRMVLLMSSYDHEKNINYAYARYLDAEGYPVGELKEIGRIEAERKSNRGDFQFNVSPNGQYLLAYLSAPIARNGDVKFSVSVIDTSLDLAWTNDVNLPYKEKAFQISDFQLDNNGNAFMLARVFLNDVMMRDRGFEKAEYYYTMLFFQPEDDKYKYTEKPIRLENKFIISLDIRFDADNNLLATGFYADKENYEPSGLFYYRIAPGEFEPEKIVVQSFPEKFLPSFDMDAPFKFGEEGSPYLRLTNFMVMDDGSIMIVAEYTLIGEYCYTDFRTALTTCNFSYYYNDIFIFKLSASGDLQWKLKIPKKQVSRNDYGQYSGFHLHWYGNDVEIFYNENPRNLEIKDPAKYAFMSDPKKSVVMSIYVEGNGHITKKKIEDNDDYKTWLRPRFSYQYSRDASLMYASRRNQYGFVRVVK